MKFIAISDTHGYHQELKLPKGDAIIHAGDFCHYGGSQENLHNFLAWYKEVDFEHKLLIGGNHDFFAAEHPDKFKEILPKEITYLNDSGTTINGIKIWGSPVQPDLVGWAFGKKRGAEMKPHWDLIPTNIDLLITHTPAFGILDKSRNGTVLGCEELTKKIEKLTLKAHIFGHVHASYGETTIGATKFINAASIGSSRGVFNKPIIFELESKGNDHET